MDGSFHEPWVERLMRRAAEGGEFDDLPGKGKPIPDLDRPYDPSWWARSWVERERQSESATDLVARVRRSLPRVLAGNDLAVMEAELRRLNVAIVALNEVLPATEQLPTLDIGGLIADRHRRLS